jgi:ElaA protein
MKSVSRNGVNNDAWDSQLHWHWYRLEEMPARLLYELMAFRESVFVVEQACIYQELDGLDIDAIHLVGTAAGRVVACLRLLPPTENRSSAQIGRVAVAAGQRNSGIGRVMMHKAIERAETDFLSSRLFLNAQTYLKTFYESLGFSPCGEEFLEDGIPHVPMALAKTGA